MTATTGSWRLSIWLIWCPVVCLALPAQVTPGGEPSARPNILVILADDLGYGDLQCYNSQSKIPTPRLNALAEQGVRLTDAHSPATVCTPTRYSLLTGRMAFRAPRGGHVFTGVGGPCLIEEGRLTLPQLLKDHGYHTACVGKWHVGMTFYDQQGQPINEDGLRAVERVDFSRAIAGSPVHRGFDYFFGTACCPTTDWLYAYIDGDRVTTPPTHTLDRSKLPQHPYAVDNRRGLQAPDFDLEEVDLVFLRKSQDFLREHVRSTPGRPFFLYHAAQAVHLPSFPARRFQGRTEQGPHGDFIFELDWVVGQLLDTLEQLKVADNTLVIFTSDNGPEVLTVYHMRHDQGHDGARPWRGVKRDNWEGGHRVPFLARWPGRIPAGTSSDTTICLTDLMATVAAIVGAQLPQDAAEDSFSILPALQGQQMETPRPPVMHQGFGGARTLAIRSGPWKYLHHQGSGGNNYAKQPMLQEYQLSEQCPEAPGQLYHLQQDPGETKNLYQQSPDIVRQLADQLQQSVDSGRSR